MKTRQLVYAVIDSGSMLGSSAICRRSPRPDSDQWTLVAAVRRSCRRRLQSSLHRRAGRRHQSASTWFLDADDVPRYSYESPRRRRAGTARPGVPPAVRIERALLRLLHAQRAMARSSSPNTMSRPNPERRQRDRNGAADDPASHQLEPQRRHAGVRIRRLPVHRRRRRRFGERPAEQRAEHERAPGEDPSHRRRSAGSDRWHPVFLAARQSLSSTAAGRDEIFAFGLRNPWRFSFDRLTGAAVGRRCRAGRARRGRHADRERRQLRLARLSRVSCARTTTPRCARHRTTSARFSITSTSTDAAP